jgi:hypothetical protein
MQVTIPPPNNAATVIPVISAPVVAKPVRSIAFRVVPGICPAVVIVPALEIPAVANAKRRPKKVLLMPSSCSELSREMVTTAYPDG